MHANKLQNVINLTAQERFGYFVRKAADFCEVWGLFNKGWAMGSDDNGNKAILLWPEREFAQLFASSKLHDHIAKAISLDDFLNKWIPGLIEDNYHVAVFPTPSSRAVFIMPDILLHAINEERTKIVGI